MVYLTLHFTKTGRTHLFGSERSSEFVFVERCFNPGSPKNTLLFCDSVIHKSNLPFLNYGRSNHVESDQGMQLATTFYY